VTAARCQSQLRVERAARRNIHAIDRPSPLISNRPALDDGVGISGTAADVGVGLAAGVFDGVTDMVGV